MYRIGICGFDETENKLVQETVGGYLKKKGILAEITVWGDGQELREAMENGQPQDLLILEAETPDFSGIELGYFIRKDLRNHELQIVYVSAKRSCMKKLFKLQPVDFLEKPITKVKLKETMGMVCDIFENDSRKFRYQRKRGYCFIPYRKIIYFAGDGHKIKMITVQGVEEFYGKMNEVERQLPKQFLAIHKSYIINKDYLVRYEPDSIELYNGYVINISKPNRKMVRENILED